MQLLERLRGRPAKAGPRRFTDDARAMRVTLDALHRELAVTPGAARPVDLRQMVEDLLEGEVAAPSADVAALVARGTDPDDFYEHEIAPSWEGLDEAHRAARLDALLEMCAMIDEAGIPADMAQAVRTKTLVLAWAFDESYGYLSRLARGEPLP